MKLKKNSVYFKEDILKALENEGLENVYEEGENYPFTREQLKEFVRYKELFFYLDKEIGENCTCYIIDREGRKNKRISFFWLRITKVLAYINYYKRIVKQLFYNFA